MKPKALKKFTVEQIATDSEGNIILAGSKGYLVIQRVTDAYSSAHFTNYNSGNGNGLHVCRVDEIPYKPGFLCGGLAF